jgi:hypothetical protein
LIAGIGQVDEEHRRRHLLCRSGARHDDADLRALIAGDERLAAVDHPMIAVERRRRLHHRGIGACPAVRGGLGHEEGGARPSLHQRLQETRLLPVRPHLADQVHIALVGRSGVAGERTQQGQAGLLEHRRRLALVEVAAIGQDMRRQHAHRARLLLEFVDQRIGRPVAVAARILLIGDHNVANERFDPCGDFRRAFRHHSSVLTMC